LVSHDAVYTSPAHLAARRLDLRHLSAISKVTVIILAAVCQSTVREIDSRWKKEAGSEILERAAGLNVNIALELRELEDAPEYPG
jgi:hypothetical protein